MSILIKNALIYDGGGGEPMKGDILTKDRKIVGIGNFSSRRADQVFDAAGAIAAPGFIDINTDSDHYLSLFSDPYQGDFLRQGVTTIIGGNCGSSLAPLITGSLESIRKWADVNQINVNWHTFAEFLEILRQRGLGVNFGTLVGHSTIRRALVGENFRDLTESELTAFKNILEDALRQGAFGFSTGLGYAHSNFVSYGEIKVLVESAAKFKRVYATHLRNETKDLITAVNEVLILAKDTGASAQINHFRPLIGFKADYEKALEMIKANASNANINFDLYPFDSSVISIYTLLPEWAKRGGLDIMMKNILNPAAREQLLKELPNISGEDLTIVKTASDHRFLNGKTLKEFAANRELKSREALLELMRITSLSAVLSYKNINFEMTEEFLVQDQAIIASNGASLPDGDFKPERYVNTFPKFLRLVKEKNLMSLEKAIFKISGLPARKYNIQNRGLIALGYHADIVILRDGKPSEVIVNGELSLENGKIKKTLKGEILKA